jgi:hypothetical protein
MTVGKYLHACDASAAAGISGTPFFAAASDENSVLRVYDRGTAGPPLSILDAATFLELDDPAKPETDIEGAAQLGERIYWIGSHGRNQSGKVKKNRQRFFATTVAHVGAVVTLQPAGRPYKSLLADLSTAPGARAVRPCRRCGGRTPCRGARRLQHRGAGANARKRASVDRLPKPRSAGKSAHRQAGESVCPCEGHDGGRPAFRGWGAGS